MGRFIDKFKKSAMATDNVINKDIRIQNRPKKYNPKIMENMPSRISDDIYNGIDEDFDENINDYNEEMADYDPYTENIQMAQKPASFHHFILENQYQETEKSIRGYKDVYNKDTQKWEVKRKKLHCFTDEEAEEILRTAQSLLATDIKLGFINKEVFGMRMMMLYKRLEQLFREIAEYRYGRYSHDEKGNELPGGYAIEQNMKLQNLKIFVELTERIVANYSRSIQGMENKMTHQSVKGQESLQQGDNFEEKRRGYA